VHLALCGFLDEDIDLVVTGINFGPNLGDDVIYSGTVAGAIEGRFLGLPSVAISLASWEGGILKRLELLLENSLVKSLMLNYRMTPF